ncbi:hypothetical protein [Methylibium petroleiphilum]|nr:hypothetical protein [Methylibium petroleiphilum]
MPEIAAWIEELRASLGAEMIDKAMRNGLKNGGFWAIEDGFVVGQPPPDAIRRAQEDLDMRERADRDAA